MRAPDLYRPPLNQPLPQQRQPLAVGQQADAKPVGGQRMALKLQVGSVSPPEAPSVPLSPASCQQPRPPPPPPPQQQQQQQQQRCWQPPARYAGGPTSWYSTSAGADQELSDCSCSNSIECLSSSVQQDSPLSAHLITQQQHLIQHQHHHHPPLHHHHHQPQPPPPPHQHQHQQLHHNHSQPLLSSNQQHHHHPQQQQQHRGQQQRPTTSNDCAFIHHHSFNHRPVGQLHQRSLPPASVPTPPPPAQQQQQHQVVGELAPLVGQSTYTATSDTITDSSLINLKQQAYSQPANGTGASDFIPANTNQERFTTTNGINEQPGGKRRQSVSFRRAATELHHSVKQPQLYSHNKNKNNNNNNSTEDVEDDDDNDDDDIEGVQDDHCPIIATKSANGARPHKLHRQRSSGLASNTPASLARLNPSEQQFGGGQQQQQVPSMRQQTCPPSPITNSQAPGTGGGGHGHLMHHHLAPGATYQPTSPPLPSHHNPLVSGGARPDQHLTMAAGSAFDGPISLPPITPHRTNSPWMRVSSIILTPIGIVIILFIVVSPLLHYAM